MPIILAIWKEDGGSRPAGANSSQDHISKKTTRAKWTGGVVQAMSACFKKPWVKTPAPQKKPKKNSREEVNLGKERSGQHWKTTSGLDLCRFEVWALYSLTVSVRMRVNAKPLSSNLWRKQTWEVLAPSSAGARHKGRPCVWHNKNSGHQTFGDLPWLTTLWDTAIPHSQRRQHQTRRAPQNCVWTLLRPCTICLFLWLIFQLYFLPVINGE
jgi:hypothetical protein